MNNKGLSLVELLITIAITGVILGAIVISYQNSLKIFTNIKSTSDNIEIKAPSIELISRFFDRWGVGVVSRADKNTCSTSVCPAQRKSLIITTTAGCSDVTFWGNIHGTGFVKELSDDLNTAHLYSCRLVNTPSNRNCYILWSNNQPMNPIVGGHVDPVALPNFNSGTSNADCSNLQSNGTLSYNLTMPATVTTATQGISIKLQSGDVIHRTPHKIRLYCGPNSQDNNRKWLYVDLTELSNGFCNDNETASPLAPVDSFQVTPLPQGCNAANGDCKALSVSITFRSQSKKYDGQYDTYTITKVFGR